MEFTFAFFRAFARSTGSKQTLTLSGTEILKCIVLPSTILSFPGSAFIYDLIAATGLSSCTFHSRLSTRRMNLRQVEGCNQFKLCELQQRALSLYAAISRTFSISNLTCNKIDIRILFATNFFIPRVTDLTKA